MNKVTNIIALSFLIFLILGCKKEQFEYGPIDFKYADNIAGTYIGTRTKGSPMDHWDPINKTFPTDTITLVVEDRRTDKVCSFYIDYFDKEFIVKPNGVFINKHLNSGDPGETTGNTYHGYFKADTLFYTCEVDYYHMNAHFTFVELKLVKQ